VRGDAADIEFVEEAEFTKAVNLPDIDIKG
jgi:hypothetical protein